MFQNDVLLDKDNIVMSPSLFFLSLSPLSGSGYRSGRAAHLPRIKEALCVLTDIPLFHTLRLYSISSLLQCSPSNYSNPIISFSAPPPRPCCLSLTISLFSVHNIPVSSLMFSFPRLLFILPSFFSSFLSSPAVAPYCSSALRLSDKGEDLL